MRRRAWILVLAAPVVAAMALLVSGSRSFTVSAGLAQASSAEVKIDNFSFGPAAVTVAVGTTVTWANRDDIPHTRSGEHTSELQSPDHLVFRLLLLKKKTKR